MKKFNDDKIIEKPKDDAGGTRIYNLRLNITKYVESYFNAQDHHNAPNRCSNNPSKTEYSFNEILIQHYQEKGFSGSVEAAIDNEVPQTTKSIPVHVPEMMETIDQTEADHLFQQPIDFSLTNSFELHKDIPRTSRSIDYSRLIDTCIQKFNYNDALEWAGQFYIRSYEEKDLMKRSNAIQYINKIRQLLGKPKLKESELDFKYLGIGPVNIVQRSEIIVDHDDQFLMPSSGIESQQQSNDSSQMEDIPSLGDNIPSLEDHISALKDIDPTMANADKDTYIKNILSNIRQTGDLHREQSFLDAIGTEFLHDANSYRENRPHNGNDQNEIKSLLQATGYYAQSLKLASFLNIEEQKLYLSNALDEIFNRLLDLKGNETKSNHILQLVIQSGDERLELQAQFDYGNFNFFLRQYKRAQENFQRALKLVVKFENTYMEAEIYYKLAQISQRLGRYRSALNYLDCNLMIIEKVGYESQLGKTYLTIADLLTKMHENETAEYFMGLYDQLWITDSAKNENSVKKTDKGDRSERRGHLLLTRLIYDEKFSFNWESAEPDRKQDSVIKLGPRSSPPVSVSQLNHDLPSTSHSSFGIQKEYDIDHVSSSSSSVALTTNIQGITDELSSSSSSDDPYFRGIIQMHRTPRQSRDESKYLPLKKRRKSRELQDNQEMSQSTYH